MTFVSLILLSTFLFVALMLWVLNSPSHHSHICTCTWGHVFLCHLSQNKSLLCNFAVIKPLKCPPGHPCNNMVAHQNKNHCSLLALIAICPCLNPLSVKFPLAYSFLIHLWPQKEKVVIHRTKEPGRDWNRLISSI